jgi:hypothetical protein
VTSSLVNADDRTAGTLLFDVEDRAVKAGETFTVNFRAAEKVRRLPVHDVLPEPGSGGRSTGREMTLDNFGVFNGAQPDDELR